MPVSCVRGFVSGRVQGVGFRYFVQRQASAEGLSGYVRNLPDGRVEFLLRGPQAAVQRVLLLIRRGPDFSQVSRLDIESADSDQRHREFVILR